MDIRIMGVDYPMKTTLRVAYEIQKANGHKPYTEIFEGFDKMLLEKQLEMLYISFKLANPEAAKQISFSQFCDDMYDNAGLDIVLEKLAAMIDGIMYNGRSPEEIAEKKSKIEAEQQKELQNP